MGALFFIPHGGLWSAYNLNHTTAYFTKCLFHEMVLSKDIKIAHSFFFQQERLWAIW